MYGDNDGFGQISIASEKTSSDRTRAIRKCTDAIMRLSSEAISLEASHASEIKRSEELLVLGEERLSALALSRAKRIHEERCRLLQRVASFHRLAMIEACGSLRISESTTHTGLEAGERVAISEVLGMVE